MGSDAAVYIFDDTAYRERVAPALRRFVHTGAADEWLEHLLRGLDWELDFSRVRSLGFSFDEICIYLGADFAFGEAAADQWSSGWERRACQSQSCPAKLICPLHESRQSAAEDFNLLLDACVVDQCLGPGQFLGRSVSPLWYSDTLVAAGFDSCHPLFGYLRKLEYRGFVVGYQFANSDGIHGWLTAEETRTFSALLAGLQLPQFEPSFQAMRSYYELGLGYEPPPPFSFEQLSLAFLRTVAAMALNESRGILWGNDLSSLWNYEKHA
jgi:hypothetical protein